MQNIIDIEMVNLFLIVKNQIFWKNLMCEL